MSKEPKEAKKEEPKEAKELTLYDLPGVGAATAEKLKEAGYDNLISIAVASPGEIVQASGLGEVVARKLINFCRNHLDMGFETGEQILQKRQSIEKISTGSKSFDTMVEGEDAIAIALTQRRTCRPTRRTFPELPEAALGARERAMDKDQPWSLSAPRVARRRCVGW